MAYSKIIITFNEDTSLNNSLGFLASSPAPNYVVYDNPVRWVNARTGAGQIPIGNPTAIAGERTAINFQYFFEYDFNSPQKYIITRDVNVVTIQSIIETIEFSDFYAFEDYLDFPEGTTNTGIEFEYQNYNGAFYAVVGVVFSQAQNNPPCSHYRVSFTTSVLTDSVSGRFNIPSGYADNPLVFEIPRGQGFAMSFTTKDASIPSSSRTINVSYTASQVPSAFNAGLLGLDIVGSPNGATVTATMYTTGIVVEYSLNNTDWQTENVFTGITPDDYTLYVRDSFGCSFTQSFTIDAFGNARIPYFLMPKENSIRFANRIAWGDSANYKTDENTLSYEADVIKPYKEIQQFQTADIITTQFRSNYTTNTAVVIEEDGTETTHTVTKATNLMGLKDKRDCRKYNLTGGKTGIYFTTGNLYDYDTGVDNGNDYILNGLLPEWAEVGTYINIDAGWYVIEDIVFDESVNAQVIIITNSYTGVDTLTQVAVVYNLENYEEYEFTIDFVDYIDQSVQVRVNANDDTFTNIVQLSEEINVKVRHSDTLEIRYKNSKNTNINYSRDLEHKLRLQIEKVGGAVSDDSETSKTDTTARLTESTIYELDKYIFSPVTKQMMRKILLALSHDTVQINGVSYVKNDSIEVSEPLEDTNLYDIVATMIKGNNAFNSNITQGNNAVNGEAVEIPGLIESDSGYVRY